MAGGPDAAAMFAALGDPTRLAVVNRLALGEAQSISRLTEGTPLTRQAMTKHLKVLEGVGLLRQIKVGRESRFALDPAPLADLTAYLELVSRQWDDALDRLRNFVEEQP